MGRDDARAAAQPLCGQQGRRRGALPCLQRQLRYGHRGTAQNANSAYAAVIAAFAKGLIAGKHPVIFGDGEQSESFGRPDLKPQHQPERAGDLKHSFADLAKAKVMLGYQPVLDFQPRLEQTMSWDKSVLA